RDERGWSARGGLAEIWRRGAGERGLSRASRLAHRRNDAAGFALWAAATASQTGLCVFGDLLFDVRHRRDDGGIQLDRGNPAAAVPGRCRAGSVGGGGGRFSQWARRCFLAGLAGLSEALHVG